MNTADRLTIAQIARQEDARAWEEVRRRLRRQHMVRQLLIVRLPQALLVAAAIGAWLFWGKL